MLRGELSERMAARPALRWTGSWLLSRKRQRLGEQRLTGRYGTLLEEAEKTAQRMRGILEGVPLSNWPPRVHSTQRCSSGCADP
jgi:hypothetical protein